MKEIIVQILKYLMNLLIAGMISFMNYISFTLHVMPPIRNTLEESFDELKEMIIEIVYDIIGIDILIIFILGILTYIIHNKIEQNSKIKELLFIILINVIIVCIGIICGALKTYNEFSIEIYNHFKLH